jgi:hypothetical protein
MLTEAQLSLVSAAVDGELSPSEVAHFRRLFDGSVEARAVYTKLKADSIRLRHLTPATPPADLSTRIMAKVAALTPRPVVLPVKVPVAAPRRITAPNTRQPVTVIPLNQEARRRAPRWLPAALAASLLLAVSGTSFWFFNRGDAKQRTFAQRSPNRPPPATQQGANDPEWAKWLPAETGPRPVAPAPSLIHTQETHVARIDPESADPNAGNPETVVLAPVPRLAVNPALMGSEVRPGPEPLSLLNIPIPFLKPLDEFNREDVRKQLQDELGRDPAFRIELFTRHMPRSVEWFRNAGKSAGINLIVDPVTLDRVSKGQATSVVVYVECLTPAEVVDLLAKLAAEDAKLSPHGFESVHCVPMVASDNDALKGIFGLDLGVFKRPNAEKPVPDPNKPINAGTVDQIVKSLSAGKQGEKNAMLMTWAPAMARTIPGTSAELKQFLTKRGDRKPSTIPVMIVIRPGNG